MSGIDEQKTPEDFPVCPECDGFCYWCGRIENGYNLMFFNPDEYLRDSQHAKVHWNKIEAERFHISDRDQLLPLITEIVCDECGYLVSRPVFDEIIWKATRYFWNVNGRYFR